MKESSILDIERRAIDYLNSLRKASRISETTLAESAFPGVQNARAKLSALRIARSNTGQPLRLRLGDFCAICHALGKNPAQELLLLWGETDASTPEEQLKSP
jgi:hypothetical protein